MNKISHRVIALLLLWLTGSQLQGQGMEFAHGTVAEVLQLAKSTDKLVFVDCITEWCGPCKKMAANTFPDSAVGAFFNKHFVNYKLDMEKGEGKEFAQKYKVRAYPTLLFLDGDGNLLHSEIGALPPSEFLEVGKTARSPEKRLSGLITEYNNGNRSIEFLTTYINKRSQLGFSVNDVIGIWADSVKPAELLENPAYFEVFIRTFNRVDTEHFQYFLAHRPAFEQNYGENQVQRKIGNNYISAIQLAKRDENQVLLESLTKDFKSVAGHYAEGELLLLEYRKVRFEDDPQKTIAIGTELAEKYYWDNWKMLNTLSWHFYQSFDDKAALQSAANWANRSIELNEIFQPWETYGFIQKKLGNSKEAIQSLEKAIELAKASGDDYSSTQEALEELKGK